MSMNGDYASMAEAVGEAPPRTGITGDEFAEILHDCGDDYEMANYLTRHIDAVQTRDAQAWHDEHDEIDLSRVDSETLAAELERRSYFD